MHKDTILQREKSNISTCEEKKVTLTEALLSLAIFSPLFHGTKYISRLLPAAAPPGASTAIISLLSKINLVQSKLQVVSSSWQVASCQQVARSSWQEVVGKCWLKLPDQVRKFQVASKLHGQVGRQVAGSSWQFSRSS